MPQNEAGIIEWTASKAMGSCTKHLAVEQVQYTSVVVREAGKFTMFCRSRVHGLLPGQSIEVEKRRAEREQTMQAGNRVCAYCVQLHVGCSYRHCPRCTWSVSHIPSWPQIFNHASRLRQQCRRPKLPPVSRQSSPKSLSLC